MNFHPGTQIIKSQGNAFSWRIEPEPIKPLTTKEKERAYQRDYAKRTYVPAAQRNAAITAFKKTQPITISPTPQADRDRSAKISGKRNEARSQ